MMGLKMDSLLAWVFSWLFAVYVFWFRMLSILLPVSVSRLLSELRGMLFDAWLFVM